MDTGVLVGAMLARDTYHEEATPIFNAVDAGEAPPVVVTEFILAETLNFLVSKGNSPIGRDALARLEASTGFKIERVPAGVVDRGKNESFQHFDGLSFVDALTVAFMEEHGLETLYSFDEGFDKVPDIVRRTKLPTRS